jgi:hypothetical protein
MKVEIRRKDGDGLELFLNGIWYRLDFRDKEVTISTWQACPRCYYEGEGEETLSFEEILNLAYAIELGKEELEKMGDN